MSDRDRILAALRARAEGKRIFGFSRGRASCEEPHRGKVPADWTHACVEGDRAWSELPTEEGVPDDGS